jgi:hypothetical protein
MGIAALLLATILIHVNNLAILSCPVFGEADMGDNVFDQVVARLLLLTNGASSNGSKPRQNR